MMNELQIIKKTSKAIHGNRSFAENFAPYEVEMFPTPESQIKQTFENHSIFECERLLKKFDWFRNLYKFKFKKYQVDVSQTDGIGIFLKEKEVGFIEKKEENRWRVGFCLVDKTEPDGFKWGFLPKFFDNADEAKKYINTYYGKIQDKFSFYEEPEQQETQTDKTEVDTKGDDYSW